MRWPTELQPGELVALRVSSPTIFDPLQSHSLAVAPAQAVGDATPAQCQSSSKGGLVLRGVSKNAGSQFFYKKMCRW